MYEEWNQLQGIWSIEQKHNVTFMHADNIFFLRKAKDEMMYQHWHVGIIDPPYGIDVTKMNLGATKDSKPKNYERGEWDGEIPTEEYWELMKYCCRNLIVWGGNYFTKEIDWSGRCFHIWDKLNNGMSFADCELALTTFDKNATIIPRSRNKKDDVEGDKRHDTQKPIYIYDYLHLHHELRGKRVLDTHGGSFSHAIAAYRNNVQLTIMDKNKSYVESGMKAFGNATLKGQMLF